MGWLKPGCLALRALSSRCPACSQLLATLQPPITVSWLRLRLARPAGEAFPRETGKPDLGDGIPEGGRPWPFPPCGTGFLHRGPWRVS